MRSSKNAFRKFQVSNAKTESYDYQPTPNVLLWREHNQTRNRIYLFCVVVRKSVELQSNGSFSQRGKSDNVLFEEDFKMS